MKTLLLSLALLCNLLFVQQSRSADPNTDNFATENLVAWCIVPFDAAKRSPAERAEMLVELGVKRCAYDWRDEHVPTFEDEIKQYQQHGIEFFAFWGVHEAAFELFDKYDLHPQIWQIMPDPGEVGEGSRVERAAQAMLPLADRTKSMQCQLGLYNHGGWNGEPENLAAVCARLHELGHDHVGIVYNFHHAHDRIQDWEAAFIVMQPYLLCLNLNGMNDAAMPKILGIGKGEHERAMIQVVLEAGYTGPIGIIDHREQLDARESLQENLDGLAKLRSELAPPPAALPASASNDFDFPIRGEPEYDVELLRGMVQLATEQGDPLSGAAVFTEDKWACISCHQVDVQGGKIGPSLSTIAAQRTPEQWVENLIWPNRHVDEQYVNWQVMTVDGEIVTGLKTASNDDSISLQNPSTGAVRKLMREEVEGERAAGSVMPSGLLSAMSGQQQLDLIAFLIELSGADSQRATELYEAVAHSMMRGPVEFEFENAPVVPDRWQNSAHPVARARLYDFYTKQAEYFRDYHPTPRLLTGFPGLDGGKPGHWGNQNETTWADDRWNKTQLSSVQSGVFFAPNLVVPRGVCLQLGEDSALFACYNLDTRQIVAVWSDRFLIFDSVRHGFVSGLKPGGTLQELPAVATESVAGEYRGFYRVGPRVVFAYDVDGVEYLDAPWFQDGQLFREIAPADQHSLAAALQGGPPQWEQIVNTKLIAGTARPYAIDTLELPYDNPWQAPVFCSGLAFLDDGSALMCTMQGDVWHATGFCGQTEGSIQWRRFAAGLHQPLGMVVHEGNIYVQCRDQLVQLKDLNGDGEADYYHCFSQAFETSPAGHDFICGLQRDAQGNFYTASGNQGLLQISADGRQTRVIATGFRNPDGLGILPDGSLTVPVSEGEWTPASAINLVPSAIDSEIFGIGSSGNAAIPHYGYRGPQDNHPPALPLVYLPRGLDNSSGGQAYVESDRFGPLESQLLHFSFGAGSWFLVLRDQVDGVDQGAVVPMAGDFLSGVHRGRFNPVDGQSYVCGMAGWGSYTPDDGCLQRVRYTGDAVQVPVQFHVHENGILVRFSEAIDPAIAGNREQHFAQCWNYRYSGAYGSPEFSTQHPGVLGHDPLPIYSATLLDDGRSLFLEIPAIQPTNQLHLRMHVNAPAELSCSPVGDGHDLFLTVHQLDRPFTEFEGYQPRKKTIAAHPLLADMALNSVRVPNPWREKLPEARAVTVEAGKNLTYVTPRIAAKAGEPLALTFRNPDVVPHNWVLVERGALESIGGLANELIANPEAFARHYVPQSEQVLVHTDVVGPTEKQTIYFRAPSEPGDYPFLCTFPGHWMVMNGVMTVSE